MKKKEKNLYKKLPPTKVDLDDIKQIVEIVKKLSSDIKIETEDYELDDINELSEIKKDYISDLTIECENPYFSIDFKSFTTDINAEGGIKTRGVFSEIQELLLKRKRIIGIFDHKFFFLFISFFPFLIGILLSMFLDEPYSIYLMLIMLAIFILFIIILAILSNKKYSLIILNDKGKNTFWKRNKDSILVGIICATAGTLIAMILYNIFF